MKYGNLSGRQKQVLFGFMKEEDVLTYPGLISNVNFEGKSKISRPTATSACNALKKIGILRTKKLKSVKNHEATNHYYMDRSFKGFGNIIKQLGLPQSNVLHRDFILQRYVQKQVDINLVRGVMMDRMRHSKPPVFHIWDSRRYELPILCLIKSSTDALVEFLTVWKPYISGPNQLRTYSFDPFTGSMRYILHIGTIEHLLFRLVFITINDLVKHGKVLARDSIVDTVSIAGGREGYVDRMSPILSMKLKNGETIDFFGGTDTEHGSKTEVPTDVDYWFDVRTSSNTEKMSDGLDIDSSDWRKKTPRNVNCPDFKSFDWDYMKLESSRGGTLTFRG